MSYGAGQFYKTFSGSDAIAFCKIRDCKPIVLGQLTTLSYSTRRRVNPIPVLGHTKVRGYTKGTLYVAGTMIFSLMNNHFVRDIAKTIPEFKNKKNIRIDELPIFDIIILCSNEYGASASMTIKDIAFSDDGGVVSIQDIISETQTSYFARDIKPFDRFDFSDGMGSPEDLLVITNESYTNYFGELPNYTLGPRNGSRLTMWLEYNGHSASWDSKTNTSIFTLKNGRKFTWKPGQPYPFPGIELSDEGYFYVTDDALLYTYINA